MFNINSYYNANNRLHLPCKVTSVFQTFPIKQRISNDDENVNYVNLKQVTF